MRFALIAAKSQSNGRKIAAKIDRQFQLIKQMLRLFVCLNDLHDVAKISCVVNYTVEPPLRPPLVSDHFPKYQNVNTEITTVGTSRSLPPRVSDRDHFLRRQFEILYYFQSIFNLR